MTCCFFTSGFYPAKLRLFIRVWLIILYGLQLFYFCNKLFSWLERRNKMFRYVYGDILFDVPSDFCSSLFCYETAETTDIDIFTLCKGILHFLDRKSVV